MNYLASPQQAINPFNLTALSVGNKRKQQLIKGELLRNGRQLLKNDIERPQFSQQIQATSLRLFRQQDAIVVTLATAERTTTVRNEADRVWLIEVAQQVEASLTEFDFTLNRLSRLIYLSPRQIRRRLKRLTGKTFSQYLKEARLQTAHRLLVQKKIKTIKKLAYQVGLRDVKYFSKQFKQYYGNRPSAFLA